MNVYFDHGNEQAILGAFLQDSNLYGALMELSVDDFHDDQCRKAFTAMHDMRAAKLDIDLQTVETYTSGRVDAAFLLGCARRCPSTAAYDTYRTQLREMRYRRDLYLAAKETMDALNAGGMSEAAADALRDKLRSIAASGDEVMSAAEVASLTFDDLARRQGGELVAVPTGLPDLDAIMTGLFGGELILIGARPAVGKSALGMSMVMSAAGRGKRVLMCSREMSAVQYGQRMYSAVSDVAGTLLRSARVGTDDWARLSEAGNQIGRLPIRFAFQTSTVEGLRRLCKREADLCGLDMLVVDYLQLMDTARRNDNEAVRLGYISVALKEIAMEYSIPVVALAQVNRQEGRADVLPTLKELKGSGNLEQDADVVIFLHHPESESDKSISQNDKALYRSLEERGEQYIVIKVAKQRQGMTGRFGVCFDPEHMTYTCIAR